MKPPELEPEAIQALRDGRKVEAIKRVREHRNLGLKEAKAIVDDYIDRHPQVYSARVMVTPGKNFLLMLVAILASIAYWIFQARQ
ncbi:50S ribosomal protein L7/L12 [Thalassocella blandensis]|nr:50S ribosomal protein L7/L12 [Thalassocella blandensis]